ncbi:MAG: dephospho-CoA kinase [Gammaproteobacteria bacterium]|nr:dephospho-CoA kinase [Gammaproteobacteria bacterium]
MWKLGLSGGIGSGKSAAADHFAALGASVVDTDVLARQVVAPGQPAFDEILSRFGPEFLNRDGSLDRAALREEVFRDPDQRVRLEAIVHPRIRERILAAWDDATGPYGVLVIPLLAEAGRRYSLDRVLVIDAPEELRIARVMARDGVDEPSVRRVLAAQAARNQRLALADDVIDNRGSLAELLGQVAALHRGYLELAAARSAATN